MLEVECWILENGTNAREQQLSAENYISLLRHFETLIPGARPRSIFTDANQPTVGDGSKVQYNMNALEHDFKRIAGYDLRELLVKAMSVAGPAVGESTMNLRLPCSEPVCTAKHSWAFNVGLLTN